MPASNRPAAEPQSETGAERLADSLLQQGVDTCFANPGTSEMNFVAALDKRPQMRCVLGLFEGVVTGAADGYARMADKPAATLLHLGPGLANGLANLHNARRARTPMINIVGDHTDAHLVHDAPLTSDIAALAAPMSDWVGRASTAEAVPAEAAEAWRIAAQRTGIATLILPANVAWGRSDAPMPAPLTLAATPRADRDETASIARLLKSGSKTLLLLGGKALRDAPLALLDAIARATGATLMAETFNARFQRGHGRVPVAKLPYPVGMAVQALASYEQVILVGAHAPVAFFEYPDQPGILTPSECRLETFCAPGTDLLASLAALAGHLGIDTEARTPAPTARTNTGVRPVTNDPLTPDTACALIAALLPDDCIVCDESITSGRSFFAQSMNGARHDYLQLTGGSIGIGPPLATGAALACPDRRVVSLQADGSAMYTLQAFWTQAREGLDITTVIFANREYAILRSEMTNLGINHFDDNARRMLTFDQPPLDWVKLAEGHGVEAARATSTRALKDLLQASFRRRGPFLIEAVL
ncbi:MAG: acetolactate synthase large subunit [Pararhodobacter sp.]|nr:acetolactate synthase large subunit [Pararhodobacter sp.]